MSTKLSRRRVLKGMLGGAAVAVGLPLFDLLFDRHGKALAQDGVVPVRFGTWFWGCGVNPDRWVPTAEGAGYDLPPELAMAVDGFQDKVSVLTGFDTPLNGRNNFPHYSPPMVTLTGDSPLDSHHIPRGTFDVEIANVIGEHPVSSLELRSRDLSSENIELPSKGCDLQQQVDTGAGRGTDGRDEDSEGSKHALEPSRAGGTAGRTLVPDAEIANLLMWIDRC